jgi:putative nucleotidyltransferase with HDIG domain
MTRSSGRLALGALAPAAREALRRLHDALGGAPAWLVGGAVRGALEGAPPVDLDVTVRRGALTLGRALAEGGGGAFVALDEARGACRVLLGGEPPVQVDLTDFRAASLGDDLRARDFTVNALAVPVSDLIERGDAVIEDPAGGLADLGARLVRPCGPRSLEDDPVRAVRAVRFALLPGWRLDPTAEVAVAAVAPRIVEVAAERVRAELVAILADPRAGSGLRALDRLGVLPALLPESRAMRDTGQPAPHRFDVWEHSLRAVEAADALLEHLAALAPWGEQLGAHLSEELGDRVTRREILKLGALLHDVAKPETRTVAEGRIRFIGHDAIGAARAADIARRWRLSRRAGEVLARLVGEHLRPMHLAQSGGVTRRARYRFYRALRDDARDLLLLGLADAAAVKGEPPVAVWAGPGGAIARDLMRGAEEEQSAVAAPLLRGEDVMRAFGLAPGPEVGRLLERAREAQAMGLVSTREAALEYLRRSGEALDTSSEGP